MTEEEDRHDKTQPPPQPNECSTERQTLKNRFSHLLIFNFISKAFKEKKTMNNEESRLENNPQPPSLNPTPDDPENATNLDTPVVRARMQFEQIKKALIGVEPEWLLPEVNPKANASQP